MGFVVSYSYYHEISKGEYNKEDPQSDSIKVGSPYEDVPLDVLAGKAMALLARRNILVFDVEIQEIVKKPVAFREADDGIVIKNKKFRFDDGGVITGVAVQDADGDPQGHLVAHVATTPHTPVHYEFYLPEDKFWVERQRQLTPQMAFTLRKRYPILEQRSVPLAKQQGSPIPGTMYTTIDDTGKRVQAYGTLFAPNLPFLVMDGVIDDEPTQNALGGDGLLWNGTVEDHNMPVLRR